MTARPEIKALAFDVFGTVVDWRGSIVREGRAWSRSMPALAGRHVDWGAFADAWRAGYKPAMDRVRRGEQAWTNIDDLHRTRLEELLTQFSLPGLTEAEKARINLVWHRLKPWPDAVRGMRQLHRRYPLATLSNGNVSLLVEMARAAKLPWDCVLSAEIFRHYKPDPETYFGAARLLGIAPQELMLVAAHRDDLVAARACGLVTAFVARPFEHGDPARGESAQAGEFDFVAADFLDLAAQLGA